MLNEGWDANTVTHILGVRAFGTQLLCEQVIGRALRPSALVYKLALHLLQRWRGSDKGLKTNLFNDFRLVTKQWLDTCLVCKGDTYPAQLEYKILADQACERILAGITNAMSANNPVRAIPDPYNPTGSTIHVNFVTAKTDLWETDARRCPVNWVVLDSDWEAEFCRVVERHPRVLAYVKNHGLGLNVPYRSLGETRQYRPDFILLVDDGHGPDNPLHLVAEVKGYRREDAKDKKLAMDTRWIPGVNNLKSYGRWAFAEFGDVYTMEVDFEAKVQAEFEKMLNNLTT
jgi:type III restriction enzyme